MAKVPEGHSVVVKVPRHPWIGAETEDEGQEKTAAVVVEAVVAAAVHCFCAMEVEVEVAVAVAVVRRAGQVAVALSTRSLSWPIEQGAKVRFCKKKKKILQVTHTETGPREQRHHTPYPSRRHRQCFE